MRQILLSLALFGSILADRLDNLSSQYLPPTGQVLRGTTTTGSQYSTTQFGGSRYPTSTGTQYSQHAGGFGANNPYTSQQPIQYATAQGQYSQGQYSGTPGQYDGTQGQDAGFQSQYNQGQYSGVQSQYATQYSGASIRRAENQPNKGDGIYSYSYETSDGTSAQESGTGSVGAQGGYSYTSPEGEVITITYTADADGFHAEGSHVPGAEAIKKSIEFNKAEQASGRYQEGQYNEYEQQSYRGPTQQLGALGATNQFLSVRNQYNVPSQKYGPADGQAFGGRGQFGVGTSQYNTQSQQYSASGPRQGFGTPSSIYGGVQNQYTQRLFQDSQGYRY